MYSKFKSIPAYFQVFLLFSSIFLLAYIDYITGWEIPLYIFYLIPILTVTWLFGGYIGAGAAVLSTLLSLITDLAWNVPHHLRFVPYWNAMNKGLMFVLVVHLVTIIRRNVKTLQLAVNEKTAALLHEIAEHKHTIRELRFASFTLENITDALYWIARDGHFVRVNDAVSAMLGYSKEELLSMSIWDVDPNFPREKWLAQFKKLKGLKSLSFETEQKRKNGDLIPVDVNVSYFVYEDAEYHCAIVRDTSERKAADERLRLMARVFEHSGEAIIITDPHNNILMVNRSFTRLTGYAPKDVYGRNPRILKSGKEDREFYGAMWDTLLNDGFWQGEIWDRRKDGSLYPKWLSLSVVRNSSGEITNFIGSFTDISERIRAAERIEFLAHHDNLTNLPNRFSLRERLVQALGQVKRSGGLLAVAFVDLDRFKKVNDSLGHHIGDILLFQVAARLVESVRSSDIVARFGGDEFVVVLTDIPSSVAAAHVVSSIQKNLSEPYMLDGHNLQITPSIGISVFPDDGDASEELIQNADIAMYHAKSQGRNNYQFFRPTMNAAAHERFLLETDLLTAIERNEFILHYQPQIEIESGRIMGVEALVRWQHPTRGFVQPVNFIPIAEDSGLILPIGNLVIECACRQLMAWISAELPPLRMSVNLSARQFKDENLLAFLKNTVTETGIPPYLLEFEVTESVAMDNAEATIVTLRNLKEMGFQLALDDFGTGYSSLSYLKLFPFDRLKIDRSFVKDLESDADDAAIAAATIALAHTLGKEVVAEGVETEGQLGFLKHQQCDIAQGYYYSRPLSAEDLAGFLSAYP